jgi:pimeloyl-ACP methyl ester carboxylesterase
MDIPALVIGHRVDRIHPFHDAEQLARRLPNGRLIQAQSLIELRVHPERLTAQIDQFLDQVWESTEEVDRKVG